MNVKNKLFPFIVILLASAITACASPVKNLPGDKYHGVAEGGGCGAFEFDIAINEDTITGQAIVRGAYQASLWDVTGSVYGDRTLTMYTETNNRMISDPQAYWRGKLTEDGADIWQPVSKWCNPPRSGKLIRR